MTKYHISPETHLVGICRAESQEKCPYGGTHYTDQEEAVLAALEQDPELIETAKNYMNGLKVDEAISEVSKKNESLLWGKANDKIENINNKSKLVGAPLGGAAAAATLGPMLWGAATPGMSGIMLGAGIAGGLYAGAFIAAPLVVLPIGTLAGWLWVKHKAKKRNAQASAEVTAEMLGGKPEEYLGKNGEVIKEKRLEALKMKLDNKLKEKGIDPASVKFDPRILDENARY